MTGPLPLPVSLVVVDSHSAFEQNVQQDLDAVAIAVGDAPLVSAGDTAGGDLTGTYPSPTIKFSVGLTGAPTAPTASAGTNTTQIATTAFITSQASWTAPSLGTNVSDYSGNTAYRKTPSGDVELRGAVGWTGAGSGVLFTLPAGSRPTTDRIFPAVAYNGATVVLCYISVGSSGAISVYGTSQTLISFSWCYLDVVRVATT